MDEQPASGQAAPGEVPLARPGRCVQGDARRDESYRRALGEERADALVTDPPYCLLTRRRKGGDERDKRARHKIDNDPVLRFETVRDYRIFSEEWLPRAVANLQPGAPLAIWTNFLGKEPILTAARGCGYPHLWGEYVWAKWTSQREGNEQLLRVYEVALVLRQTPRPALAPGDKSPTWCVAAGYDDEGEAARWGSHPNHKPFSALEPLLRELTAPGQLVLDPFAGSGSIPAAALRLSRRAAAIELESEWANRAASRLLDSIERGTPAQSR